MRKSLIALVGAAGLGIGAMAAPAAAPRPRSPHRRADCFGSAVGAGILGGVAAGAIIGSAIANSPPPGYCLRRQLSGRRSRPARDVAPCG